MDDDPNSTPASDSLPPFVRGLMQPSAYPHAPASVRLVQTHISYVWIADDLVYKAKKPVDFGFINQVDAKTREAFCHLEVELNRRLAPDVYLEVVPIVQRADGTFAVEGPVRAGEGDGERVVEWAVKMRRLPDDRSLDQLLAANAVPDDLVERLTHKLVAFHVAARTVEYDPAFAGVEAERAWWAREYREAEGNIATEGNGGTWTAEDAATLRKFVARMLDAQADLFNERLAAGRVVEGHGDLHAKHVYVLRDETDAHDGIAIVDCIEFTEWFHFRYLDVGYDIAFLAMDLEARGHRALGDEIAGRYIVDTADETMGVLQPLHRAFRAFVRGKVESIGANDAGMDEAQRRELAGTAAGYFRLAARYAERQAPPLLVMLCGLSGTGKTSVGGVLAGRIGAALVSTDAVRAEVAAERGLSTMMWQQYEAGAYSPEMNAAVYDEMRRRARAHIEAGRAVILDGTHRRVSDRESALAMARELGVPSLVVELRLSEAAALARLREREAARGATTPDEAAYRRHVEEFEPVSPAEGSILALDATQSLVMLAEQIEDALG
ncbi:MAG: AAA family ATPase [Chloroflexi bacterium]|nr:AAA family ATPase [Chloroflexota bacterium]